MREKTGILKRTLLLFCLIMLFACFACQKVSEDKRTEFIGFWHASIGDGDCASININSDGTGAYCLRYDYEESKIYSGRIRVNDKHIYIAGQNRFDIIEYPHMIDTSIERVYVYNHVDDSHKIGNWKMVLYGLKPGSMHISGEWDYYKADY